MDIVVKTKLYNQAGEVIGEKELNSQIFGVSLNNDLLHQAIVAHLANSRKVIAHTKQRGEVRGGGKKPWKQKGTGRARHGSSRSPLWIGGAITFGPRSDRNFSKKINKKMKRKALFMALSNKVEHNRLILIDKFDLDEIKTKKVVDLFKKFSEVQNSVLFVYAKNGSNISKSVRNIPGVQALDANSLNVRDIVKFKTIIMLEDSLPILEKIYLVQ